MAYTTINKPADYFNTKLYTGNGGSNSITGVGFQPDTIWIKYRGGVGNHRLVDVVRGTQQRLMPNDTAAESTETGLVTSFDSDGFTLNSTDAAFNGSSNSYVSWNWLADNTSGSSNTDGDITSSVSVNTTSGFSIVGYTGNGTTGATVGHGLGVAPKVVIQKRRTGNIASWRVYHGSIHASSGETNTLLLNSTNANGADPDNISGVSTTTFTTRGTGGTNPSGDSCIAYCFAEKKGFSKFDSYTGNGSADGTFVYTGFKPAMIIVKSSSLSGTFWDMYDSTRNTSNPTTLALFPNSSAAEETSYTERFDLLSNGFKVRTTASALNTSGATYIYMAFAENPLVTSSGIPATAR